MPPSEWNPRIEDVDRFTRADCHYLAKEISAILNLPVQTFDCSPRPSWMDDQDDSGSVHAFVQLPDGRIADVEGLHDPNEFFKVWNDMWPDEVHTWSPKPWKSIQSWWGSPTWSDHTRRRAKQVARRFCEAHGLV